MAFKQGTTLYANGSVDLNTTADPNTSSVIKQFSKGQAVGEIYGVYPFADKSGVAYSVSGGYIYDSDPITNVAPSSGGSNSSGPDLYTTSNVNCRDKADMTGNILFTVEPGYVGTVLSSNEGDGTWYKVKDSDGDISYVKKGSYLSTNAPAAGAKDSTGNTIPSGKKTQSKDKPKNYAKIFTWVIAAGLAAYGVYWYINKRKKKEKAK